MVICNTALKLVTIALAQAANSPKYRTAGKNETDHYSSQVKFRGAGPHAPLGAD